MVSFLWCIDQAVAFQILLDLVLDQITFRIVIISQIILALIGHQREVQLCYHVYLW